MLRVYMMCEGGLGGISRGGARPLGGGGGLALAIACLVQVFTWMPAVGCRRSRDPATTSSTSATRWSGLTKPQWVYGRPTEFEQIPDDRNSLVFDSAPLDRDLEILGLPDREDPGQRRCARRPDRGALDRSDARGKSWLVTYNVLNLTRRDSMEQPTALESRQVLRRRTAALHDRAPIQEGKSDPSGDFGELVAADLAVAADRDPGYRARCFAPGAPRPPRPGEGGAFHHPGHPRGSPRCQVRRRICQRSELGEDSARGSQASPDADSRCGGTNPIRQ